MAEKFSFEIVVAERGDVVANRAQGVRDALRVLADAFGSLRIDAGMAHAVAVLLADNRPRDAAAALTWARYAATMSGLGSANDYHVPPNFVTALADGLVITTSAGVVITINVEVSGVFPHPATVTVAIDYGRNSTVCHGDVVEAVAAYKASGD